LIWPSFSSDFLQVDQLWDVRVHEYVVASSDTVKPKTKSFNKTPEIREGDIPESAGRKLSEHLRRFMPVPQITLGLHLTNSRATTRSFTIAT